MMRSDALRRGARTFLDIAFVEALLQCLMAFGVDFSEAQHAALLVIAPFFVSAFKNALEDNGTIPALLKAPASEGENPVPDPPKKAAPRKRAPAKKAAPRKRA